jgi:hypothetical protein
MIIPCKNEDINSVFDYIAEDYGKCLYIYIDLKKFGLNDDNFNVWIQYNKDNQICAIISEYFGGIQLYSKSYDFISDEIVEFIKNKEPHVLFGMKQIIDKIQEFLPNYTQEDGIISELKQLKHTPNPDAYSAPIEEISEIVELVSQDEDIGKPYGYESLYKQYCERKNDNFGRNYLLRDENTNDIICHAGTYAELPQLAVIGGVITSLPYRGKGFSKETLASLCAELKSENKDIFSFYYIPSAKKMHEGVGFEEIGIWSKLTKVE